jgi:hypothetical protein
MDIYGIIDSNGGHIDISRNLNAAKAYATKHGYKQISIRYNCGYVCEIIAEKTNNKWTKL